MLWLAFFLTYPWPLEPSSQAHPISGTLGEFRRNRLGSHLHSGVDIPGSFEVIAHETLYIDEIVVKSCNDTAIYTFVISTGRIRLDPSR